LCLNGQSWRGRMAPRRILLEKNRLQLELKLQSDLIKSLLKQGWFATKTSDRFKAGRPDLRIGHDDYGQLDVELKYSLVDFSEEEEETGLTKLQKIKIEEMNKHGMPAVGMVYVEPRNLFFFTAVLRDTLPPLQRCVNRLPGSDVISGPVLFVKAMEHLNGIGHHRETRDWRSVRPSRGS
jgi:hypothetical protein